MLRTIKELDVHNKIAILRLDLNLPSKEGKFTDATRIIRSLPTIKYLQSMQAKIVIISHMGRPKGLFSRELSLAPVVDELEKHIKTKVLFATDCLGTKVKSKIEDLKFGDILLLENLRFHKEEEENDEHFAQKIASLGDVFINDCFSCSHRKHASIEKIAQILPSAAGFLLIDEINNLQNLLQSPQKPFTAIIGGSKISTKIDLLFSLLDKVDNLILAGAMANTFLGGQKICIGKSMTESTLESVAIEIIKTSQQKQTKIFLPQDFIVQNTAGEIFLRIAGQIKQDEAIMDVGPGFTNQIAKLINQSKTLVWNGPLGAFETQPFDAASIQTARTIASATINNNLNSIAGGGDTIALLKSSGMLSAVKYTSTGGGAFLAWFEGKDLPGIRVLYK